MHVLLGHKINRFVVVCLTITAVVGTGLLVGCEDKQMPTALEGAGPVFAISDAMHGSEGNPHFFFLSPISFPRHGDFNGEFDAELQPTVEICEWANEACIGDPISRFTMGGGQIWENVKVFPLLQRYTVYWITWGLGLQPGEIYRIRVLHGAVELGYADVDVVSRFWDVITYEERDEFVPMLPGFTLPIRFRIEQGALCDPEVEQCVTEVVTADSGGTVVLEEPGVDPDEWDRVDIPPQPGGVYHFIDENGEHDTTSTITFAVSTCDGFLEDPVGDCVDVSADYPTVVLEEPAVVSVCGIDTDTYNDPLLTIYRNHDGEITPLVHTHDNCALNEPIGNSESSGLLRFAKAGWNAVGRPLMRAITPAPLVASAPMVLHRGKGGLTDIFSEFEVAAPSDKFPGLVSWWTGDQHYDDLYGDNPGVPNGTVTFEPGMWSDAFLFHGIAGNVLAQQADTGYDFGSLQEITVQAWVKLAAAPDSTIDRWITMAGDYTKLVLRHDGENSPGQLHFYMGFGTSGEDLEHIRVNNVLSAGCFNHVVGTYDGSDMRLFLNGAEVGSSPVVGTVNDASVTEIGWGDDGEAFNGWIDDVAIYNRALDLGEIEQVWDSAGAGKCVGASGATSTITIDPTALTVGDTATLTLQARDEQGQDIVVGGSSVQFLPQAGALTGNGTVGSVSDNGDGTYTAVFVATSYGTPLTIGARIDGETVTTPLPSVTISFAPLNPAQAEALIGGSFLTWWSGIEGYDPSMALSVVADELSSSWRNFGMFDLSQEPRIAFDNTPMYARRAFNEVPWSNMYLALSAVYDGLRSLNEVDGLAGADSVRAYAFGKFVQGLAHGWLALMFDQAFVFDETVDLTTDVVELQDYNAVMAHALGYFDEAIGYASTADFTLPGDWINGNPLTDDELIQLIHSYYARFMTQVARTPAERDAVDWNAVLAHAAQGIGQDFTIDGDGGYSGWFHAMQYFGSLEVWTRADYKTIGWTDNGIGYADWLALLVAERYEFSLLSNDMRVTAYGDTVGGTDFQYHGPSQFRPERGTYHFSLYGHIRYVAYADADGLAPITAMKTTEMDLIEAEAMLRMGNLAGATALVNNTRVSRGGLPPAVGADPQELMDQLIYEKRLENYAVCSGCAFFDRRGWGNPSPTGPDHHQGLVEGTPFHFPIPGSELERLGLDYYTFGGVGPAPVAAMAGVGASAAVPAGAVYYFEPGMTAAEKLTFMRDRAATLVADALAQAQH